MSAIQSYLSSAHFGYNFVVATTQASINATMKEFMSQGGMPVTTMCYIVNSAGAIVPIDYATLVANAHGSDPFNVPNGVDVHTNQDVKNLSAAGFLYGFKAALGLPAGYAPADMPDIVTLGADTSTVGYSMMCSSFAVTQATYGPVGITSWLNQSQQPGAAWIFNSKVDLRMSTADSSAYSKLPPAVQEQIHNLGGNAFGVQQLLFDLDSAALSTVPTISGVAPGSPLYACLQEMFMGAYFTSLQTKNLPGLNYTITQTTAPPSTLTLTNLNMQVDPFVGADGLPVANPTRDQQQLATLNYLCATNGATLPPASAFNWNWVDPTQSSNFDGVIAINRNTLAAYYQSLLTPYAMGACFKPVTGVTAHMMGSLDVTWNLLPYQTPTASISASGPQVLTLSYASAADSHDKSGLTYGEFDLHTSYTCNLSFAGNTITVVQNLVIWLKVTFDLTPASGNVVNQTITDTYTLAVNSSGALQTTLTGSTSVDNSETPDFGWFMNLISDFQNIVTDVQAYSKKIAATSLQDIPAADIQNFVFPGGQTFAFKDVAFSNNQDLVSHITYAQPTQHTPA